MELGDEGLDGGFGWGRGGRAGEEVAYYLLLVGRVWRVDGERQGFAVEGVGDVDAVLVGGIGVGEDVGALEGLRREAKDVVDEENGGGGTGRAGDV